MKYLLPLLGTAVLGVGSWGLWKYFTRVPDLQLLTGGAYNFQITATPGEKLTLGTSQWVIPPGVPVNVPAGSPSASAIAFWTGPSKMLDEASMPVLTDSQGNKAKIEITNYASPL